MFDVENRIYRRMTMKNRMKGLWASGALFAALTLTGTEAPYEIRKPDFKTYSFESDSIPDDFSAGPGSKLTISADYAKNGSKSLRWDWDREGAWIEFRNPDAFRHLTGKSPDPIVYEWVTFCDLSSFSSWIFCPEKIGGQLKFEIGGSRFYVNLNFTGWTFNSLLYGRDLARFPDPGAAAMRITAPPGVAKGTLIFDDFAPRREMDVRSVRSSSRMPYVARRDLSSEQVVWMEADAYESPFSVAIFDPAAPRISLETPERLSEEQLRILQRIGEEFLQRFPSGTAFHPDEKKRLNEIRKHWALRRTGKFVSGRISNIPAFYADLHTVGRALQFGKMTPSEQMQWRTLMLDMADLVIQQGHGSFYGMRTSFIAPVRLLREELKAAGRFDALIARLRFIAGVDELYLKECHGNADFYNTLLESCIGVIFLQDDLRIRYRDLLALKRWLNLTSENGELWPDGTMTHHSMIYSGYNLPALGPICRTLHLLRNSPFFPEEMYRLIRKSVMVMAFYSNPYIPHMFSGRWRECPKFSFGLAGNLALVAEALPEMDRACAARYLAFERFYRMKTPAGDRFRAAGIVPDPMSGTAALNYAVSMIHRQGNEMAVVRGQRNGMFANEIYAFQGANTMGRYLNFGQMQILGETPEKSGFILNKGWNYNFWPGTTARIIPADALRQHFENVEARTTEPFAGAVALAGAGMWAMKLQEELPEVGDPLRVGPPVWFLGVGEYAKRCRASQIDTSFRARKSVFAFDGMMLMLGSGIISSDTAPVATTLFQNSLKMLDKTKFRAGKGFFIDSAGNGYAFREGEITLQRGKTAWPFHPYWNQKSPALHQKLEPNEGEMELAYLNHGPAPQNAGYEYLVCFPSRAGRVRRIAEFWRSSPEKLPFRIVRRDRGAHIVHIPDQRLTGYALFESGAVAFGELRKVSAPCIVMIQRERGKMRLALLNPLLDLPGSGYWKQGNVTTRIRLKEGWEAAESSACLRVLGGSEFEIRNEHLEATTILFKYKEKTQ